MPSHGDDRNNRDDVLVIGAGPAGEAAAELARNLGYSVAATYTYGYKMAAADTLTRLHPDVLNDMNLPSQAYRITKHRRSPG
ncbi:MAG: hypothetical protein ACRDNT_04560 [Streptosporangiaceae bacterium]